MIAVAKDTTPAGSLCLFVKGEPYSLMIQPAEPGQECLAQFRLTKVGGKSYLVTLDLRGHLHCQCGDYHFRREHSNRGDCKHGRSLRETSLVDLCKRRTE